ncbi:hypothetical protein BST61_g8961 [Cercospora zeina]
MPLVWRGCDDLVHNGLRTRTYSRSTACSPSTFRRDACEAAGHVLHCHAAPRCCTSPSPTPVPIAAEYCAAEQIKN